MDMPVRLILEADDPETESVLAYHEGRFGANDVRKRTVLKAALGWLEIKCPLTFSDGVPERTSLQVSAGDVPPVSS